MNINSEDAARWLRVNRPDIKYLAAIDMAESSSFRHVTMKAVVIEVETDILVDRRYVSAKDKWDHLSKLLALTKELKKVWGDNLIILNDTNPNVDFGDEFTSNPELKSIAEQTKMITNR